MFSFKYCLLGPSFSRRFIFSTFILQEAISAGDTIRTIVKFLSHDHSQEREEAVSLLYELSKSEALCEKIGGVSGAILILVGMSSSKSENVLTVEKAEKTLDNLEKCENNVRQMAESGRLQPLLTLILEGASYLISLLSICLLKFVCLLIFSQSFSQLIITMFFVS